MKKRKILKLFITFFITYCFSYFTGAIKGSAPNISSKSNYFDETARFFAGKGISENSRLYTYTKSRFYRRYKKQIIEGWNKFQKPNMEKIKKWWVKHAPKEYNKKILYPFSGPDIMNALTFFPEGKLFIMFGLEKPGVAPEPHNMTPGKITAGLNGLRNSLGSIFRYNFFRTLGMAKNLKNNSFNSISGLVMLFLSLNGYYIIDVRVIAIDSESRLVDGIDSDRKIMWQSPPESKRIPGVEIKFRDSTGNEKKIRYFMLNVIDHALKEFSPNFIPYLYKEGNYTTIIKSASYLMHNDKVKFTMIRSALLLLSEYIVQDDSGIPLRYFNSSEWMVHFHGYYNMPISLFKHRYQQDLKKAFIKFSTGSLPFSYGYNFKKNRSNLMTIEKLKKSNSQ